MKKGPRCPVCGSHQIKEVPEQEPQPRKEYQEEPVLKPKWKCYDCYRNFEKPDEGN